MCIGCDDSCHGVSFCITIRAWGQPRARSRKQIRERMTHRSLRLGLGRLGGNIARRSSAEVEGREETDRVEFGLDGSDEFS